MHVKRSKGVTLGEFLALSCFLRGRLCSGGVLCMYII